MIENESGTDVGRPGKGYADRAGPPGGARHVVDEEADGEQAEGSVGCWRQTAGDVWGGKWRGEVDAEGEEEDDGASQVRCQVAEEESLRKVSIHTTDTKRE